MKRPDWFLPGMICAVFLARLWPEPGAHGGALHPELLNKLGVALIFFLHGLTLAADAFRAGTLKWPLHLIVQASTFLLFPLLGLALIALLAGVLPDDLRVGVFFLCALPSTVSSSVALTAVARGDVPAALFNATLSSVIGVFVTPFWLTTVRPGASGSLPIGSVIWDLALWLIVPLALGQSLRPLLGRFATQHKAQISRVDRATILLLIYTSFCDSFKAGVWRGHGVVSLLTAAGLCAVILAFIMTATALLARAVKLPFEDRIVAIFCGSKKTLASGVPMARLIFGADPGLSVILLPLMIFHPLQLLVCGWFAARWGRR
jgi:solute carrier family 10 (sodium/bile acid cotransporter), member 7